jgi:hypothetical protein
MSEKIQCCSCKRRVIKMRSLPVRVGELLRFGCDRCFVWDAALKKSIGIDEDLSPPYVMPPASRLAYTLVRTIENARLPSTVVRRAAIASADYRFDLTVHIPGVSEHDKDAIAEAMAAYMASRNLQETS